MDKYHVEGWVQITVSVDCIVEAESLQEAEDIVSDGIENWDCDYGDSIKCNNYDLSSTLLEDE